MKTRQCRMIKYKFVGLFSFLQKKIKKKSLKKRINGDI